MKIDGGDYAEALVVITDTLMRFKRSHSSIQKISVQLTDFEDRPESLLNFLVWSDLDGKPIIIEDYILVDGEWLKRS